MIKIMFQSLVSEDSDFHEAHARSFSPHILDSAVQPTSLSSHCEPLHEPPTASDSGATNVTSTQRSDLGAPAPSGLRIQIPPSQLHHESPYPSPTGTIR